MPLLKPQPGVLTQSSLARVSGGVYLILILTGVLSLAYVPSTLFVWDDALQTMANIQTSELLFRLSIVSGFVCFIAYVVLVLLLYRLLVASGESLAVLMVAFVLVSVPITFVGFSHLFDVLTFIGDDQIVQSMPAEEKAANILLSLQAFNNKNTIAGIFWGLWLLPFGLLVYRSGFLPKAIGAFLMLGCLGYVVEFLLQFIFKVESVPFYVSLPGTLGEFGICLWMLIVGASKQKVNVQNAAS